MQCAAVTITLRRDQRRGAGSLPRSMLSDADEAPRRLVHRHQHAIVMTEEVIVDRHRSVAPQAIGAVGMGAARAVAVARLFADAVEGGGAAVVLIAQPGDVAAIAVIGALRAGARAEIRFIAFAIARAIGRNCPRGCGCARQSE